jgi:outer membrane protein OmpA-like peptidoglycan-associated protein
MMLFQTTIPLVLVLAAPDAAPPEGNCTPGAAQLYFAPGGDRIQAVADDSIAALAAGVAAAPDSFKVTIVGHSDTTGSPKLNLDLSGRRAQNVADELVGRGVPRAVIDVRAAGEGRLAVDTRDNVAEAQNRRVSVVAEPVLDLRKVFAGGDPSPPRMCDSVGIP